jgi:hypothetical protein
LALNRTLRIKDYNIHRTKIAEGTTADFAAVIGFQVEDFADPVSVDSDDRYIGLNGTYPALLEEDFRHLEGTLLTVCDATFTNKEQREAFKKIVTNALWGYFHNKIQETIDVYDRNKDARLQDKY